MVCLKINSSLTLSRPLEHSNTEQQIAPGKVQRQEGRLLGGERPHQIRLPVAHIRVVRHVHILSADVFAQFGKVPQLETAIEPAGGQHNPITTEAQGMHGSGMTAEGRYKVTMSQIPYQYPTVGRTGRQITTADGER